MNGTRDTSGTAAADYGDGFDAGDTAALVDQAGREARRQFRATRPWLSVTRAVVVLAAYGATWLSVPGQHPYRGPSGLVIVIVYALVAVALRAAIAARQRASAGVAGQSRRPVRRAPGPGCRHGLAAPRVIVHS